MQSRAMVLTEPGQLALETFDVPPYGLEGELTMYLSRYRRLHLVVELELAADREASDEFGDGLDTGFGNESAREPDDPYRTGPAVRQEPDPVPIYTDRRFGSSWETFPEVEEPRYAPLTYQISEDRIVRDGEVRYYDHPKFGVIARIARIEADEEEEQPDEVDQDAATPASAFTQ